MCKVKAMDGEEIIGKFYENEMSLVRGKRALASGMIERREVE